MIKGLSELNTLPPAQASLQLQKMQAVMGLLTLILITYSVLNKGK